MTRGRIGVTLGGMEKYWSVEDCCWVDCPGQEAAQQELSVPQQREDEPVMEPVEA
jgi:hypothetical protein